MTWLGALLEMQLAVVGLTPQRAATCEERVLAAFPAYQFSAGSTERGPPQPEHDAIPSRVTTDFDGDDQVDTALLLRPVNGEGKYAIAVCLTSLPAATPVLIVDAYTAAPLTVTPKDRTYYDFGTGEEGRYEHDAIGSYCCECCGATYVWRGRRFVEIIDSD